MPMRVGLCVLLITLACARSRPTPAPVDVGRVVIQPASPRSAPTCGSMPLRSSGQIRYVCDCQPGAAPGCVPGNDGNDGRSPAKPMRSYARAADVFVDLDAGSTVAFCRGGRWQVALGATWVNPKCRKDKTCDIRDYAPPWGKGGEPRPALWIDGGRDGASLLSFMHPPAHMEGYRVLNLDLHGGAADTGIFFFNETTDVDLCNLNADGFGISVHVAGGDKPTYGVSSRIVLRHSVITNNTNIAYLAVCDDCAVEDNVFDNNGVRDIFTHSIYFASQAFNVDGRSVVHTSQGMRLSRNEIHHSKQVCRGAPIVVHGRHQDVVIEDNLIDAVAATDECWGPGVGCGAYDYGCWFRNTVIRNNVVKNLGNVGSDDSNCVGCTIENNLFVMTRDGTGISIGGTTPRPVGDPSYKQWDGSADQPSQAVTIRNNTIYFTEAARAATGVALWSGQGQAIENNAIAFAGRGKEQACYRLPAPTGTQDQAGAALAMADYNVCSVRGDRWVTYASAEPASLEDWQRTGFDRHSKQADPKFSNPPVDFVPAAGSPLIDTARPTGSPKQDLARKRRDEKPDIGAYER